MTTPADNLPERVSDKDLEQIARKGVAYTREARLMARELIERRQKERETFHPLAGVYP